MGSSLFILGICLEEGEYTYKHRKKKCLCDNNVDILYYVTSHLKVGYILCSFQRGQPDRTQINSKRDRGQMQISKEDIMYISRS